jgi:hypothetical protein
MPVSKAWAAWQVGILEFRRKVLDLIAAPGAGSARNVTRRSPTAEWLSVGNNPLFVFGGTMKEPKLAKAVKVAADGGKSVWHET